MSYPKENIESNVRMGLRGYRFIGIGILLEVMIGESANVFVRCAGIRVIGASIVIINAGKERLQILQEIYVERIMSISG